MSRDSWEKINFRNRAGLVWLGLEQYWKFIAGSSLCSARFAFSSLSSNSYSIPYSIELELYTQANSNLNNCGLKTKKVPGCSLAARFMEHFKISNNNYLIITVTCMNMKQL